MKTQLPKFEGKTPARGAMKLSGSTEDRVGCLAYGEEVYFVAKGTVSGVAHLDVKDVFTRLHTIAPTAIVLLERADGERMLTEGQMLADERFGVESLFSGGEEANGTFTDKEGTGEDAPQDPPADAGAA